MNEADRQELKRARERADLARQRFANAFEGVLHRVTPDRLRADAMDAATSQFASVRRDLMQRLRHWPFAFAALFVALLAMIFWQPARNLGRQILRLVELVLALQHLWRPKDE